MEFAFVPDSGVRPVGIKRSTTMVLMVLVGIFAFNPGWAMAAPKDAEKASKSDETTARNAALENLREKILTLKLTGAITVVDFADTNKEVREAVSMWLASIKKTGKVTVADDGVVTVTVTVSMRSIRLRLSDIYASYYDGKKIKSDDINDIAETNRCKEVWATGTSKPGEKDSRPTPVEMPTTTPTVSPDENTPPAGLSEDCWKNDLIPLQIERAKQMAELAAKKNALSRLGERLRDVKIGEAGGKKFTVNDFVVNSNQPDVDMSEFMRAATRKQLTLRPDLLVCEIQMQAELKPAIAIFKSWADENYTGDKANIQLLRDYVEKEKPETITEIGIGVVEPKYVKERLVNQQKRLMKFASSPPLWIGETIEVTGEAAIDTKGNDEKKSFIIARNDALRAAKADAEKKLMEILLGLEIPGNSSIKDIVAKSPGFAEKLTSIENLDKKVQPVDDPQLEKDKIVRVKVSTKLRPVWDMVLLDHSK